MTLSIEGASFIAQFEGFSAKPYVDPASGGEPITIGYGSTIYPDGTKVTMKDTPITTQRALSCLILHVNTKVAPYINKTFTGLNQAQFDSLCSFAYNLGSGNLDISSLKRDIMAKKGTDIITADFLKWNKAGGKIMNGLTRRRAAEAKLYSTGQYA